MDDYLICYSIDEKLPSVQRLNTNLVEVKVVHK